MEPVAYAAAPNQNSTTVRSMANPAPRRRRPRLSQQGAMAMVRRATMVTERLGHPVSTWLAERIWLTPVPRRPRLRPPEQALVQEATRFQVPVDGGSVSGWRWGEGQRAVLLLHGWCGYGL